jgi:hypothetical protein
VPDRSLPPPGRSLPARPSLRHLKLEAKRRLAAGEFATLHDAQAALAREHGLPGWTALKQACALLADPGESHALAHVRWIIERFRDADQPGWPPPGDDEFTEHFDDRFLAAIPADTLTEMFIRNAANLRGEPTVIRQVPFEAQVQLAGLRYVAVTTPEPPHRLVGVRGFPLAERITDSRLKERPPVRSAGQPPPEIGPIAVQACAELGLPALLLAGGGPSGSA